MNIMKTENPDFCWLSDMLYTRAWLLTCRLGGNNWLLHAAVILCVGHLIRHNSSVVQVLLSVMHPYVWQECRIFIILVLSDEVKYMINDALGTIACMYSLYLYIDVCGSDQLWGVDSIVRKRSRKATLKTRNSGRTSLLVSKLMGFCDLLECKVTGNLEFHCHRLLCFSIILTFRSPTL
jgi:hypothetical protein